MNKKKQMLLLLSLLLGTGLFSLNTEAKSNIAIKTQIIDHAKDPKKAKKWAEENYHDWQKKLTHEEKKAFSKLLEPVNKDEDQAFANINSQLKAYGGDLSTCPVDLPAENKILTDHISRISRAINRREGKLDKPLIVYKNETLQEVVHIKDQYFRDPNGLLKNEKLLELRKDFSYGKHKEFRIFDLYEDSSQNKMIKWKIKLPAGTPTGLIGEHQVVIDKNSAFKVTAIKTISVKGKQIIRIDAKLIPEEIVQNENDQILKKIRENFAKRLNLPPTKELIAFNLTGSASHFIAKRLEQTIDTFLSSIDQTILHKTFQFISPQGGKLICTDQELYSLANVYEPEKITLIKVLVMMDAMGFYNLEGNRTISVHIPNELEKGNIVTDSLLHEFGHALDNLAGDLLGTHLNKLSDTAEFRKIFRKEGKNLTEYGKTNSSEFFAEAFWMMHASQENIVQKKAPKTHLFLKNALKLVHEKF